MMRTNRVWRPVALGSLAAMLVAGCGLRVPSEETALRAGDRVGTSGGAVSGGTGDLGSPTDTGVDAAAGADPGTDGALAAGGDAGSAGAAAPAAVDGAAGTAGPTEGGSGGGSGTGGGAKCESGGPSGDGVTADSVTVGGIAGLGGPADATLVPYKIGYDAAVNEINAQGGVCGRKIRVIWANTGGSA